MLNACRHRLYVPRWFHVRACIVSGIGFFTDAYDIFAISLAVEMICVVLHGSSDKCPDECSLGFSQDLGLKIATPVGTLVGQLLFGWFADLVGRKRMYGVELTISKLSPSNLFKVTELCMV